MTPNPILSVEYVSLDELQKDQANPRRISDADREALIRSFQTYGNVQPILVRRADKTIIAGHQRYDVARILGMPTIPVIWSDVSQRDAHRLNLALNKISGEWDPLLLPRYLAELNEIPGMDLRSSGFPEDEVQALIGTLVAREKRDRPETFDLDSALGAATREARTKPGGLWTLGDHRLLCGDATRPEDVERLLGGERASMTFTDPPYGVDLGHHGGHQRGARRRVIPNDALDPIAWEAFLRTSMGNVLEATDGAIYVCMSSKELPLLSRILADKGGHWSDTLIWQKDRFVLGRADYQRAYEPIWFGWREGADHFWCGDRDQGDVWTIARPAEAPLHPVMKPLALMERAIANSSRPGDLVLDVFLGSGSTLIACERTGRRCAGLELDPIYCDVVVARWERFSGSVAVLANG